MNKTFLFSLAMLACMPAGSVAQVESKDAAPNISGGYVRHPWHGKRVGYIGDSITDPKNNSNDIKEKFWGFLHRWLGITPYVYGVSGRQWSDVPRQAELLEKEHGGEVDAIIVFIGTNDYNAGVPVGKWFAETDDTVMVASRGVKTLCRRKKRVPVMSKETFKGRINIGISRLKQLFPDRQIVLLTPLHRAYAKFSDTNIQPDENWQNACGEYVDAYVNAVKEAGNVWGVPVIDLNSVSGLNPMIGEQLDYFHDSVSDRLHPSTSGQERIARTLMYQLLTLPSGFTE